MKKIILRGQNSFIGKNCKLILKNKFNIIKFSKNQKIQNTNETYLFHLAAKTSVIKSFTNPKSTILTNIKLLLDSLEFCRKNKIKLIFFSTAYQKDVNKFTSPYSFSKNICESTCEYYSKTFKMDICVIRLTNIYGKFQKKNLINDMINNLKRKKIIEIVNHNISRDFLYIKDLILALEKITSKFPKKISVFNISQSKNLNIFNAILIIKDIMNSNSILIKKKIKNAQSTFRNKKISNAKFKKQFMWKPKFNFVDGIKDILNEKK
jgi:nucleoside-diphosphate-sugar epimerase